MSYEDLIAEEGLLSKKAYEKLIQARNAGTFQQHDSDARGMRCAIGSSGSLNEGQMVQLYWLVDLTDGMIVDAKFQVFGPSALICAADALCELVIGKNYDQAKRIGVDLIDKKLRDPGESQAFPDSFRKYCNLALEALDAAAAACSDIPLGESYVTPLPHDEIRGEGYPGWTQLPTSQKLTLIEELLNTEVRPYVELDEGGILVQELVQDTQLIIAYQGSCTSCYSAIGTTLSTIQSILQTKLHPSLTVVPNLDSLKF